jgi:RNA polymerase sigma-70 factor (ECF subfamily)
MPIRLTGTIDELPFLKATTATFSAKPSEIECEVIKLFDQFRNSLLRYVLSFGLSVDDGEEVTQEVFLALVRHLQLGKSRQNLRGWLFRVAHNLALRQRQFNRRSHAEMDSDGMLAEGQLDPSPNPEERVLFTQRQRRLLAVLHALPEQDRCCLRLRAEGLRYREIGHVLGISLGAVSLSLTRSLARLMCADER